jgi:cell division transport system permease protein
MLAATTLMLLGVGFALAVNATAHRLHAVTAHRLIVQVTEPDPARRARIAAQVAALLQAQAAVASVERIADAEVARLVDPYIGDVVPEDVVLPAMIDVRLHPDAEDAVVTGALGRHPSVRVTSAEREAGDLPRTLAGLRKAALLVLIATAAATGLIAAFAARAALAAEQGILALLHELGATDYQLFGLLLDRIGRDAAIGAVSGLALGLIAMVSVGWWLTPLGLSGLGLGGWLVLPLLPLGLLLLVLAVALATIWLSRRRAW